MATVSGYAQILKSEELFHLYANNNVDNIIKSIRDMSFNDFSVTQELFKGLISDASSLWNASVDDNKAHLKISGDNAMVLVDKILLQSVIFNLLHNAIEVKHGGKISLRVDTTTNAVKIYIPYDTKIDRDLDSIFTVYEASHKENSTDLGLAFYKDVMEKMNGTIACATQDSKTCFTITLPLG